MIDNKYSTYFIIKNNIVLSTKNFSLEDKLKNCLYIRKLGSNTHPIFYLDIKENNEWIIKNKLIGDYKSFIDFVINNSDKTICIRGFSKAYMGHFISNINLLNNDYKFIKFNSEINRLKYEQHLLTKEDRLEDLKEKLKDKEIDNIDEYKKITNNIFNKKKIKSRNRINNIRFNNK